MTLTRGKYEEFLRLTHAAKSASIASIAQTGNASVYLAHSLGPWILDSDASNHLSGNKHLFTSLTITSPLPMITLASGTQTMAKGIGSACPLSSLPLTFVLYVPDSPFNIISVSKLIHDLNCSITLSHSSVTLQDQSTRRTINIGHESQSLFHLSSTPSSTVCTSTNDPLLIHRCIDHPNFSKLRKMVSRFSSLSSLECESCQFGKHTHVSFPKRLESRTKSPFELIHTDVWGLPRTASTLGFWYFVAYINDISRCTWLFLMKSRTELFSLFQKFFVEIRNQFHTSICILRSDNTL